MGKEYKSLVLQFFLANGGYCYSQDNLQEDGICVIAHLARFYTFWGLGQILISRSA